MDAGRNPTTGAIECRAKFDPASAIILQRGDLDATQTATLQAKLAADIAACVPYNPFGAGNNAASAAYFSYNGNQRGSLDQLVINGFIAGDTSGFFNLPGGAAEFVLGAEYRREKSFYQQDSFSESGLTNAVVIPKFDPPAFSVKEAFAELNLPVLADKPFFDKLTISGAARIAKYGSGTGSVWSYNGGAQWAPIKDIRFRFNYGRAVRAPNVSETGFPLVPNFAPGFADPCSPSRINNGTSSRAANCQADLGALLSNLTDTTYSLAVVSGSNPKLQAEKSDSYTIGGVFEPSFVPGLNLSVDFYKITVNGVIANVSAQNIANLCYDQPTLNNVFCSQFTRYRGTVVPGPSGNEPFIGAIQGNSLIQAPLNYARRVRKGIDTQITYKKKLDADWSINSELIYTHNLKISNYQDPTLPNFEDRILEELGDPKDEFRWDTDVKYKDFTLGYRMRFIGPMYVTTYEAFNVLPTACTASGTCPPTNADFADIQKYPSVFYHDLRLQFDKTDPGLSVAKLQAYIGVDNIFNKIPPLGLTATGAGSAIYDYRGRYVYAGIKLGF
jgi:outer membrane receptor protein involved in Fe transport